MPPALAAALLRGRCSVPTRRCSMPPGRYSQRYRGYREPADGGSSLFLTLEPIADKDRMSEETLWARFYRERPRILGALCSALSHGLKELPRTKLDRLPRMADFCLWATACKSVLWKRERLSAYRSNVEGAIDDVIDTFTVAAAVRSLMAERTVWTGQASNLLGALESEVGEKVAKSKIWPDSPRALASRTCGVRRPICGGPKSRSNLIARARREPARSSSRGCRIQTGILRPHRPYRPPRGTMPTSALSDNRNAYPIWPHQRPRHLGRRSDRPTG